MPTNINNLLDICGNLNIDGDNIFNVSTINFDSNKYFKVNLDKSNLQSNYQENTNTPDDSEQPTFTTIDGFDRGYFNYDSKSTNDNKIIDQSINDVFCTISYFNPNLDDDKKLITLCSPSKLGYGDDEFNVNSQGKLSYSYVKINKYFSERGIELDNVWNSDKALNENCSFFDFSGNWQEWHKTSKLEDWHITWALPLNYKFNGYTLWDKHNNKIVSNTKSNIIQYQNSNNKSTYELSHDKFLTTPYNEKIQQSTSNTPGSGVLNFNINEGDFFDKVRIKITKHNGVDYTSDNLILSTQGVSDPRTAVDSGLRIINTPIGDSLYDFAFYITILKVIIPKKKFLIKINFTNNYYSDYDLLPLYFGRNNNGWAFLYISSVAYSLNHSFKEINLIYDEINDEFYFQFPTLTTLRSYNPEIIYPSMKKHYHWEYRYENNYLIFGNNTSTGVETYTGPATLSADLYVARNTNVNFPSINPINDESKAFRFKLESSDSATKKIPDRIYTTTTNNTENIYKTNSTTYNNQNNLYNSWMLSAPRPYYGNFKPTADSAYGVGNDNRIRTMLMSNHGIRGTFANKLCYIANSDVSNNYGITYEEILNEGMIGTAVFNIDNDLISSDFNYSEVAYNKSVNDGLVSSYIYRFSVHDSTRFEIYTESKNIYNIKIYNTQVKNEFEVNKNYSIVKSDFWNSQSPSQDHGFVFAPNSTNPKETDIQRGLIDSSGNVLSSIVKNNASFGYIGIVDLIDISTNVTINEQNDVDAGCIYCNIRYKVTNNIGEEKEVYLMMGYNNVLTGDEYNSDYININPDTTSDILDIDFPLNFGIGATLWTERKEKAHRFRLYFPHLKDSLAPIYSGTGVPTAPINQDELSENIIYSTDTAHLFKVDNEKIMETKNDKIILYKDLEIFGSINFKASDDVNNYITNVEKIKDRESDREITSYIIPQGTDGFGPFDPNGSLNDTLDCNNNNIINLNNIISCNSITLTKLIGRELRLEETNSFLTVGSSSSKRVKIEQDGIIRIGNNITIDLKKYNDILSSINSLETSIDTISQGGSTTPAEILDNSITESKLAFGAVTSSIIANNAVTQGKIASGVITNSQISDTADISGSKIADGTITATKIADGAITGTQIANNTITATQIANNTITGTQIADGAISAAKLADGPVTTGIADGAITAANFSTNDLDLSTIPKLSVKNIDVYGRLNFIASGGYDNRFSYNNNSIQIASNSRGVDDNYYHVGTGISTFSIGTFSDDRLKINEKLFYSNSSDLLMKLRPQIYDKVNFKFDLSANSFNENLDLDASYTEFGLMAQELYTIPELRDLVGVPEDSDMEKIKDTKIYEGSLNEIQGYYEEQGWGIKTPAAINYQGLIPLLIKGFQEQQSIIVEQKMALENEKEKVLLLRKQLEAANEYSLSQTNEININKDIINKLKNSNTFEEFKQSLQN